MHTIKTVLWGMLGIRRKADHEQAEAALNPLHLALAAVAFVILFVLTLRFIVSLVVG